MLSKEMIFLRNQLKNAFKNLYDSTKKNLNFSLTKFEFDQECYISLTEAINDRGSQFIKLIRREDWGAIPQKTRLMTHFPTKITVHHQGGIPKDSNYKQIPNYRGVKTIQEIQKHHMVNNGFVDIGYHFIISPKGEVFEGRYMNQTACHVKLNNDGNIGILVLGNFEVEEPLEVQIWALKRTICHIHANYPNIDLPSAINSHRSFTYTPCPGKNLHGYVMNLKQGLIRYDS